MLWRGLMERKLELGKNATFTCLWRYSVLMTTLHYDAILNIIIWLFKILYSDW